MSIHLNNINKIWQEMIIINYNDQIIPDVWQLQNTIITSTCVSEINRVHWYPIHHDSNKEILSEPAQTKTCERQNITKFSIKQK